MIKVYALLPRRPDISAEEFHHHWATVHRKHALRITRLRRYVQAHRLDRDLAGIDTAPYDGIPEVWYDSLASAIGQSSDPDYTEHAQRDEPSFVEMARIAWVMTDERLVLDELVLEDDDDVGKALVFVRRPAGTEPAPFARAWPGAAANAIRALPGVRRAAVSTTLAETYRDDEPAYDGVLELWWRDLPALDAGWRTGGPSALAALGEVAALDRSHAAVVHELRVIWPGPDRTPAPTQEEAAR